MADENKEPEDKLRDLFFRIVDAAPQDTPNAFLSLADNNFRLVTLLRIIIAEDPNVPIAEREFEDPENIIHDVVMNTIEVMSQARARYEENSELYKEITRHMFSVLHDFYGRRD